jgi:hypothetical protein
MDHRFVLIAALLACAACGPPREIDAPPPAAVLETASDSETVAPPSYASAPVRLDLRLVLREIEQTIPDHIGSLENRLLISRSPRTWVAIEVLRGPLEIELGSSSMTLTALVAYRGRVWRKIPLTTISASCGTGDQAPVARIRIRTTYRVTSRWRIRTKSEVLGVERATAEPADECRVTFVGINVTEKVLDAAREAIQKQLTLADARLASVDVRGALAPVWSALQQPIPIADSTIWLTLDPREVGVGPITVRDSIAHATVTLRAQPRIRAGVRPEPDSLPLPNMTRVAAADTVVAVLDGSLSYAAATDILQKELRGQRLRVRGRRIVIEDVAMSYVGRNRVALEVRVSGAVVGRMHLTGTPTYDAARDAITVPDLAYDVQTSNLLVHGITWLAGNKFRNELRRKAILPASAMLDLARGLANQEITRKLADGVRLSGEIGAARALTAHATPQGLRAQARGVGKLALDIRLEDVFANTHIPREPIKGIEEAEAEDSASVAD